MPAMPPGESTRRWVRNISRTAFSQSPPWTRTLATAASMAGRMSMDSVMK